MQGGVRARLPVLFFASRSQTMLQRLKYPVDIGPDLVQEILQNTTLQPRATSEIEIRLRSYADRKGVTQTFFSNTLDLLETFQEWESVEEKKSIDYYFGEDHRTTQQADGTVRTIKKKKVCSTDVSVNHPQIAFCRISHKTEEEEKHPPALVQVTLARFKDRRSFVYRGWSYDLTRVWEGSEVSEVKSRPTLGIPPDVYEVEIERLPDHPFRTLDHLVVSLLLKAKSILASSDDLRFRCSNTRPTKPTERPSLL